MMYDHNDKNDETVYYPEPDDTDLDGGRYSGGSVGGKD